MKEAAGEANLTVITIVLIGVVVAVGVILVPRLMGNTATKACCTDAGGKWSGGTCGNYVDTNGSTEFQNCCKAAGGTDAQCGTTPTPSGNTGG